MSLSRKISDILEDSKAMSLNLNSQDAIDFDTQKKVKLPRGTYFEIGIDDDSGMRIIRNKDDDLFLIK